MTQPSTVHRTQRAELVITVPAAQWMSSNQRLHWAAKAKRTAWVRNVTAYDATQAGLPTGLQTVHVTAFIGYPTAAKADPANASPTLKAILDGLTDAGIWPDDDSEHVVAVEYRRDPQKAPRGTHTVRLVLTEEQAA